MAVVYLALGTNLGDRAANLRQAVAALPPVVQVTRVSRIYETPPWGYTDQPAFLNMALAGQTGFAPQELLNHLKKLEIELGRVESFHYGPRQIDIDILFYDDLVLDTLPLVIPHPRLHERGFVLVPLAEIAPDLRHPLFNKSIRDLLGNVETAGIREFSG